MNLNRPPQSTGLVSAGKRIYNLWNSRNRIARIIILATAGLVLNCCCVIIPFGNSLAPNHTMDVEAILIPAFAMASEPLIPTTVAIPADLGLGHNDARVVCKDFNPRTTLQAGTGVAHSQLDGRAWDRLP